jgi:hypothetical protein
MPLTHTDDRSRSANDVIDWLLDADPSIRWQVACGGRRGRAVARRVGGVGPAAARSAAPRRPVG